MKHRFPRALSPLTVRAIAQRRIAQLRPATALALAVDPVMDPEAKRLEITRRRELLTMPQAAAKLGYTGKPAAHAAYCFLRRHRLLIKRGNAVLAYVGEIEDVLDTLRVGATR